MAASVCSSEEDNNNISGSSGRCCEDESYSLSADISESDSSSGCFSGCHGASSSSFAATHSVSGSDSTFRFPLIGGNDAVMIWDKKKPRKLPDSDLSEIDMIKEKFAKLLLGEDMSGGGKGVCTALAISNAITNLSASLFGELWRLEPLASHKKAMWEREMGWLLSVSDSIVDFVPSKQQSPDGGTYEVMATYTRADLALNLPALRKLDSMLITILDGFCNTEFWYFDRGIVLAEGETFPSNGRQAIRQEEKWWLPYPKLPPNGLSENARKRLQQCWDCANQILKAALSINTNVLAEMEIPNAYLESLPKNGKACLGDIIYRYMSAENFSAEHLLDCLDLSSEHHALEVANRIEGAIFAWKLKDSKKHTNNNSKNKHSSWSGKVIGLVIDGDKNAYLAQRAETLLHSLKLRFPGLPQTSLDMTKIQYNKSSVVPYHRRLITHHEPGVSLEAAFLFVRVEDVGQAILESYSRVLESLAFNITARIDDVMFVDNATKHSESLSTFNRGGLEGRPIQKRMSLSPFSIQNTPYSSPFATPTFSSSPILIRSPTRAQPTPINDDNRFSDDKLDILKQADMEKLWK